MQDTEKEKNELTQKEEKINEGGLNTSMDFPPPLPENLNEEILGNIDELDEIEESEEEVQEIEVIFEDETIVETEITIENEVQTELEAESSNEEEISIETDPTLEALEGEEEIEVPEEVDWQEKTGLDENSLCGAIETVIFMNDKPLPLQKIKALVGEDIPLRVLHEGIERLQKEYEESHHGLRLVEVAGGFQFRTKAKYARFVQDLFKVNSLVLTPATLEVLAIIAYKQPASKLEIDKIRGVDSSHLIRGLIEKRLVKISGKSNELGKPTTYSTTPEFLEVFGLANLEELPSEHEIEAMAPNKVGISTDLKEIVQSKTNHFVQDETEELEALTGLIKSISSDTIFTKSLKVEDKKRKNEEGKVVKSAFDILEDFVVQDEIKSQMKQAAESQTFTPIVDPKVIKDLDAYPFNIPEDIDEDFEMIDLNTGERLEEEIKEDQEDNNLFPETSLDQEAEDLQKALDEAFEKMSDEKLETIKEELQEGQTLEGKEVYIDDLTEAMVNKAKDYEIDLDFLIQKDGEKNTQEGTENHGKLDN